MTRLAIFSDIHGNMPALEAVLADVANFNVDQIIVAGDVINFGPFSRQAAELVIKMGWPVIRGNNEFFLIDYHTPRAPEVWNDPVQFAPILWLDRQFDDRLKTLIACWPDALNLRFRDAPPIQVFHGTPRDPWEPIYPTSSEDEVGELIDNLNTDFAICGHTHLAMDRKVGKRRIFNPGSVGVPLDGIFSASYMILDGNGGGWEPTFRRIPFDYQTIFEEFEKSGFNRESGPIGRLTLEIYKQARPVMGFLRWHQLQRQNAPLKNELVDEFLGTCNWWEFAHPAYHINMK